MIVLRILAIVAALIGAYFAFSILGFRDPLDGETHEQMMKRKAADHKRLGIKG